MPVLPESDRPYVSPTQKPGLLARALPSATFYSKVARIVFRSAAAARRGLYDGHAFAQSSQQILQALESLGTRVSVEGLDVLNTFDGPCIIVGNHMSTLETFLLPGMVMPIKPVTFVVKRSLVDYPVFGAVMRSRDPVVVDRTNPREDLKVMLQGGHDRLSSGISLIVFPQTTRTVNFDPAHFNSIGVKLAKREKVPVVPLALKTDAWGNGRVIKDFGPVRPSKDVFFSFGQPLEVTDNERAVHQEVVRHVQSHLEQWTRQESAGA